MAGFHNFQTSVYHQMEDAILWPPTEGILEPGQFDVNTMARFTMPHDGLMSWQSEMASPSSVSQTLSNTDPMDSMSEAMSTSESQTSSCPSFGFSSQQASQWHVQDQDPMWQSLDHCCSNEAYHHAHEVALQNTPLFSPQLPAHSHSYIAMQPSDEADQLSHMPIRHPLPDVFASTHSNYKDPPTPPSSTPLDACPQRKSKRCAEDLYTPRWVRYTGPLREGWCGWCAAWFTLRDSAYWYHMHYSHGVSQTNNGRRLPSPAAFRAFGSTPPIEWEVRCGKCARWMALPPGDKWNTAYFRHTYKCYFKTAGSGSKGERSGPASPASVAISPAGR